MGREANNRGVQKDLSNTAVQHAALAVLKKDGRLWQYRLRSESPEIMGAKQLPANHATLRPGNGMAASWLESCETVADNTARVDMLSSSVVDLHAKNNA